MIMFATVIIAWFLLMTLGDHIVTMTMEGFCLPLLLFQDLWYVIGLP